MEYPRVMTADNEIITIKKVDKKKCTGCSYFKSRYLNRGITEARINEMRYSI